MNKLRNNVAGFGAVVTLLVVAIIILIGGIGYFVYKNNHKTVTPSVTTMTKQTDLASPIFNKLPAGWTEYKNDVNGLRLGFPKEWGILDSVTLHTSDYRDDTKNLQGQLAVVISKKDGFTVMARKYGAIIKPSSDGKNWTVSEENSADVDSYKVGDTYKTSETKVNGGTAVDLSFVDEECTQTRWLFTLKDSYVLVTVPELCPVNSEPISAANKTAYTKLVSDLLSTVTIY